MPSDSHPQKITVFLGWDSRESDVSDILAHSIRRRTQAEVHFRYLKHRDLRKAGLFTRPWLVRSADGENIDLVDNKPFSTEFSHTRFLIPQLMNHKGWALFCDADMLFLSDIAKLWEFTNNPQYALLCVKHTHNPPANIQKMDGRLQQQYFRKNWSSFVLWNCAHEAHRQFTYESVNAMTGADLHAFKWVADHQIGDLPKTYNWISGISPKLEKDQRGRPVPPAVVHYTEGGPWFKGYENIPLGDLWEREREHWIEDGAPGYEVRG